MYQAFTFNQSVAMEAQLPTPMRLMNVLGQMEGGNFLANYAGQFTPASDAGLGFDISHSHTCACCGGANARFEKVEAADTVTTNTIFAADIPGDTTTTVTIAPGGSVTSELETTGDTDWIAITLTAGQTIEISLFGSGASPVSDTYLRVRGADGHVIDEDDDGGAGYNSALRFTATADGTYYIEVDSYANNKIGEYTLTVTEPEPIREFTYDEIGAQLSHGYWGGSPHSFDVGSDGSLTVNITSLPSDAQALARAALLSWTDVTGIQFVEVSSGAEITFQDTASGAYANSSWSGTTTISSTVNVSANWLANYGTAINSYSYQTYIHEIGHALGLGHGGNYNGSASYVSDALYVNDAWSTTIMSYFDQSENTFFSDQDFTRVYVITPMAGDIAAMQTLYGLSTTTRTGDTTYGFGSNSNRAIHDADQYVSVGYTIVDSGGHDRLNYSGFTQDQVINLNPETFMNIGGQIGNVVIGRGTDIEDAIGGSGNDTITGNLLENYINGNAGDDTIFGGSSSDRLSGGDGDDTIDGGFGSDTIYGGIGADTISGSSHNDFIGGNDGNDTLNGDRGADNIRGGNGLDTINGGDGDDRLYGDEGADTISGGNGEDYILAGGSNDVVNGGWGNDFIRGQDGDDRLAGALGDDSIGGGAGNDRIRGGRGNDLLAGNSGFDTFVFDEALSAGNVDTIADFLSGTDTIELDLSIFTALSSGGLQQGEFRLGSAATSSSHHIIYNQNTGELFYDADGAGGQAQVLFARLGAGTDLTRTDFSTGGSGAEALDTAKIDSAMPDILGVDTMIYG